MKNISVNPYNPEWVSQFEALHRAIWPHISDIAQSLEHIGSTSVPGLAAKPIIDMTIVLPEKSKTSILIKRLASIGINHQGDLGISGREAFTRLPEYPDHNLYACVTGSQALRNHLTIRDVLRADSGLASKYAKLKYHLGSKFEKDIDAYVEGKSAFLLAILKGQGFSDTDLQNIEAVNRKPGNG